MSFQEEKEAPLQVTSSSSVPLSPEALLLRTKLARRGLLIYLLLLFPSATLLGGLTLVTHSQSIFSIFFLMWTPALASLAIRWFLGEGIEDISFRIGGRRTFQGIGLAIVTPLGVCIVAYGSAWFLHLAPFETFHASDSLVAFISLAGKPPLALAAGLTLLYLTFIELVAATGEEIGWRGYMLTRLIDAQVPRPVLVSGLIWSLWHWPSILLSPPVAGMPQLVTASIFLITITSLGCICARLRLETGSIWPSVFLHAAWNAIVIEIFDSFTQGTDTSLWTGEAGILVALTMVVVAFIFSQGAWKMMRTPITRETARP